ncbi:MAG: MBL fold metallo-hydrolase [Nocardioidaceae bacterium]|nr:MBL fold metallo-hydrolase [Nocardioidaceae bacterium]
MSTLTHVRHATVLIEIGGQTMLVDPMLGDQDAYAAVEGTMNPRTWPLVGLPVPARDVVARATGVLFTHTHVDHVDDLALGLVAEARLPVFCQPEDEAELRRRGVEDVRPVAGSATFGALSIVRTGGRHGTGETADLMGPVSGYVLVDPSASDSVYVAGDTVWCAEVRDVLDGHQPVVTIVNSGEARMEDGDPITMSAADVLAVARALPATVVVAVHLEALNHCGLTRYALAEEVRAAGARVLIPADGERIELAVSAPAS